MDGLYYKVVAIILLIPWFLFGLTLVGYFRNRLHRKAQAG